MEYNKNFSNFKNSIKISNTNLLIIVKEKYNKIYNILININKILELQKSSYEKYLQNSNNNLGKITP